MSKKTHRIITTNGAKQKFITYKRDPQGNLIETGSIFIGGGANVYNGVVVPASVGTLVSDKELEDLKQNPIFNRMEKAGFIIVVSPNVKQEEATNDLQDKDNSAQMTVEDIKTPGVNVVNKNGEILVNMEQKTEDGESVTITTAPSGKGRGRGRPSSKNK